MLAKDTMNKYITAFFQDVYSTLKELNEYFIQKFSIKYFIISVIHFLITFYNDSLIFEYHEINLAKFVIAKTIFLIILIVVWQFIGYLIKNYSTSDNIKNFVKFSGIYFFVMMLIHLMLWPFIVFDQMYYLYLHDSVTFSTMGAFQGIFIRYFRIYALMLIPNFAGIIILQLIVISAVLGYIMVLIKSHFKLKKAVYLVYIPFFMPLVLHYNLSMEKDILYSYFFMLLFAQLIFLELKSKFFSINIKLFIIAMLSAVVMSLRSEGILFFVVTPGILYILNHKILKLRKMVLFLFFSVLWSFVFIPHYVSSVILDKNGEAYKNVSVINDATLKFLLKKASQERNKDIINEFDQTSKLKIKKILNEKVGNVGFYFSLSKSEKKRFENIVDKLIESYFDEYVKFKFKTYYQNGFYFSSIKPNILSPDKVDAQMMPAYYLVKDEIEYLNEGLYSKTIKLVKKYRKSFDPGELSVAFIIIYSFIFAGAIFMRLKKIFILVCFLAILYMIEILAVPFPVFRFFFPWYITSFVFILYIFFYFFSRKKHLAL